VVREGDVVVVCDNDYRFLMLALLLLKGIESQMGKWEHEMKSIRIHTIIGNAVALHIRGPEVIKRSPVVGSKLVARNHLHFVGKGSASVVIDAWFLPGFVVTAQEFVLNPLAEAFEGDTEMELASAKEERRLKCGGQVNELVRREVEVLKIGREKEIRDLLADTGTATLTEDGTRSVSPSSGGVGTHDECQEGHD
jgi:hypothetical protein